MLSWLPLFAFYTPKHGSWLPHPEIVEGSPNPNLGFYPPNDSTAIPQQTLTPEVTAWQSKWQFTTQIARVELQRLYPSVSMNQTTREDSACNLESLA